MKAKAEFIVTKSGLTTDQAAIEAINGAMITWLPEAINGDDPLVYVYKWGGFYTLDFYPSSGSEPGLCVEPTTLSSAGDNGKLEWCVVERVDLQSQVDKLTAKCVALEKELKREKARREIDWETVTEDDGPGLYLATVHEENVGEVVAEHYRDKGYRYRAILGAVTLEFEHESLEEAKKAVEDAYLDTLDFQKPNPA